MQLVFLFYILVTIDTSHSLRSTGSELLQRSEITSGQTQIKITDILTIIPVLLKLLRPFPFMIVDRDGVIVGDGREKYGCASANRKMIRGRRSVYLESTVAQFYCCPVVCCPTRAFFARSN